MYALTDLRKENFVDKRYWEKSCKYSIRKLSVGAASVLLGAVFLAAQGVAADGVEMKVRQPLLKPLLNRIPKLRKLLLLTQRLSL